MGKVIALCGKICSGKSTYAEKIRNEYNAVVLNPDIIMLSFFNEQLGDKHDEIVEKIRNYLYQMAAKIVSTGTNVILDFGLWTHAERQNIRAFFDERNIEIMIHYVKSPIEEINKHVQKRNLCRDGTTYFIDAGILEKCLNLFEEPYNAEIDVIFENTAV